jgi:hypothetical protein
VVEQNLVLNVTGQELAKDAAFKIGQDAVMPVNVTDHPYTWG